MLPATSLLVASIKHKAKNMSRAFSKDVQRDVKMVFDLFVETLKGGTPGQSYVVHYQRGTKEKGSSEPTKANAEGVVEFKLHKSFVCTLQRKNNVSYRKKDFRLYVVEHPGGFIVIDLNYDLAAPVVNEMFPVKKMVAKSPTGSSQVLFSLSAITEEEFIRANSDASAIKRESLTAASVSQQRQPASQQQQQRQDSRAELSDKEEGSDDEIDQLVNNAVAQASGRSATESPAASVPPSQKGRSVSPPPRQQLQQQAQPQPSHETSSSAVEVQPPAARPQPSPHGSWVKRNVAPVPPEAELQREPTASPSPAVPQPQQTFVAPSAGLEKPPVAPAAAQNTAQPALAHAASKSSSAQPNVRKETSATGFARDRYDSADGMHREDSSDVVGGRNFPAAATARMEKDVDWYLSEVCASVVHLAEECAAGGSGAQKSVSGKTLHHFLPGTKTSSTIPKASIILLHCINYWTGQKRSIFLHDFISMLFVDVIPNTRHAASWMNVLLHVLYHNLSGDAEDSSADVSLDDDASLQLVDDLLACISNAQECGYGARNNFMRKGCRIDTLSQLLPKEEDILSLDANPPRPTRTPLPAASSIILTIALDESLRRLSDVASRDAFDDISRFCFPPSRPPTNRTSNGYHFTGGSKSSHSYGLGAGGPDSGSDDPAFTVVLNSLNKLYEAIHGATREKVGSTSALLRLVGAELFKIAFRNIAHTLLNHITQPSQTSGTPTSRLRTMRDGMNFKLALSMFERWMQENGLFTTCRAELLPCRQVCDLLILQKKLLRNADMSDEVTSCLNPQLVVFLLEQYDSYAGESDAIDVVPLDVLESFRRVADEKVREAKRVASLHRSRSLVDPAALPQNPVAPLSSFCFVDFVSSLLAAGEDELGEQRKSIRGSIAVFKGKEATGAGSQGRSAAELRALNWDYSASHLSELRSREALLGINLTHDADGRELNPTEAALAQLRLAQRVAALSSVDSDVIRTMVV